MNLRQITIKDQLELKKVYFDSILSLDRRANILCKAIKKKESYDPLGILDWVNIFAIATCEENASGSNIDHNLFFCCEQ